MIDRAARWRSVYAVEVSGVGHAQLLGGLCGARDASLVPPQARVDHEDVSLLADDAQIVVGRMGMTYGWGRSILLGR